MSSLPINWELQKLSKVLEAQNGYAFNSKKFSFTDGIPLIRIRDIKLGIGTKTLYLGDYDNKFIVKAGDLLIGMDGDFSCHKWRGGDALLNQRVCRLQGFSERLLPQFLFYGINKYLKDIEAVTTFTTVKHLSSSTIKAIQFPLPPLPEQQRIVSILDEAFKSIDKAIANTEKNLANARELFESYLNNVFTQKGEGWVEYKLGDKDLVKIVDGDRGKSYPKKTDFQDDGYCLFLNTKNVREDGFSFKSKMFITEEKDATLRKGKLERRDVILTTRGTIGNIAVYDDSVEFENIRINSGMLIFRPNENLITSEFLFEIMRSSIFKAQSSEHVSGAAQPQLPIKTLVSFTIPVPDSLDEQEELVENLHTLLHETKELEDIYSSKLASLNELKQSILQKAFSGELTSENIKQQVNG